MNNLVIFADSSSIISNILVEELLRYIFNVNLFKKEKLLVVDTYKNPYKNIFKRTIIYLVKCIFNYSDYPCSYKYIKLLSINIYSICKKYGIKVIHVPNINEPSFIRIINNLKPARGLALGCPQIFKKEAIEKFDLLVNYHNSLLPKYRGLNATSWSIYMGEKQTGFTFHIVNENIDDGNILIFDSIDINNKSTFECEIEKTNRAAQKIPELYKMISNKFNGTPQTGEKNYFGKRDLENIITINNIEDLTYSELLKRIRAFGGVKIKKEKETIYITKVKKINKSSRCDFVTKDGTQIKILRYSYLPKLIFNFYKLIKMLGTTRMRNDQ